MTARGCKAAIILRQQSLMGFLQRILIIDIHGFGGIGILSVQDRKFVGIWSLRREEPTHQGTAAGSTFFDRAWWTKAWNLLHGRGSCCRGVLRLQFTLNIAKSIEKLDVIPIREQTETLRKKVHLNAATVQCHQTHWSKVRYLEPSAPCEGSWDSCTGATGGSSNKGGRLGVGKRGCSGSDRRADDLLGSCGSSL